MINYKKGIGEKRYVKTHSDSGELLSNAEQAEKIARWREFYNSGNNGSLLGKSPETSDEFNINAQDGSGVSQGIGGASQLYSAASGGGGDAIGGTLGAAAGGATLGGLFATTGATAGTAVAPGIGTAGGAAIGAGIGATAGLIGGLARSRSERRKRQAAANERAYTGIAQNEQNKVQQQNASLQSIMAALKGSFGGF